MTGAPNGSYERLSGTGQHNAGWFYRENWPSAEDLAYDAEYMKIVIESQKVRIFWDVNSFSLICTFVNRLQYIPRYPYYDFHHCPHVYSHDPSSRWVGM